MATMLNYKFGRITKLCYKIVYYSKFISKRIVQSNNSKTRSKDTQRFENRVLVLSDHDVNKDQNQIWSAMDVFAFSSDYAIQVDSNLTTNGNIYNIGYVVDMKEPYSHVEWSYKICKTATHSSFGPSLVGKEWFDFKSSNRIFAYPSSDINPSACSIKLYLKPERWLEIAESLGYPGKYIGYGALITRKDFIDHKEHTPQIYHLLFKPHFNNIGYIKLDEFCSLQELNDIIFSLWPTILKPKMIDFKMNNNVIDKAQYIDIKIKSLYNQRFSVLIDGTEYAFNDGTPIEKYSPSFFKRTMLSVFSLFS